MVREKDLLRVPAEVMPLEQCAMLREMLTAYRLLEEAGLKVGCRWRGKALCDGWAGRRRRLRMRPGVLLAGFAPASMTISCTTTHVHTNFAHPSRLPLGSRATP